MEFSHCCNAQYALVYDGRASCTPPARGARGIFKERIPFKIRILGKSTGLFGDLKQKKSGETLRFCTDLRLTFFAEAPILGART